MRSKNVRFYESEEEIKTEMCQPIVDLDQIHVLAFHVKVHFLLVHCSVWIFAKPDLRDKKRGLAMCKKQNKQTWLQCINLAWFSWTYLRRSSDHHRIACA